MDLIGDQMAKTTDLETNHRILVDMLESQADAKTAEWFTNYLKGEIQYRGLKTGMLKAILIDFFNKTELNELEESEQLKHIQYWLSKPMAEDKLTAILWLQIIVKSKIKRGSKDRDLSNVISTIESAFENGYIHDWSTNDWLCVRVLELIPEKTSAHVSRIESWIESESAWQRRSAILAFKKSSKQGNYHINIEQLIAKALPSEERFVQTGIGWVLADASRNYPEWSESLFEKYFDLLSKEVITRHTKYLPNHSDYKIRARQK